MNEHIPKIYMAWTGNITPDPYNSSQELYKELYHWATQADIHGPAPYIVPTTTHML